MANLITYTDFAAYRDITVNISDVKRLDTYISEAQNFDLRPLLGEELYFDFINNLTVQKYIDLKNGKNYIPSDYTATFNFLGIKPVLVYFTYSRFLLNDNYRSTNAGFVQKVTEHSNPVDEKTIARLASQARASALSYWKDVLLFLYTYSDTYTLWGGNDKVDKIVGSSGFDITAIY